MGPPAEPVVLLARAVPALFPIPQPNRVQAPPGWLPLPWCLLTQSRPEKFPYPSPPTRAKPHAPLSFSAPRPQTNVISAEARSAKRRDLYFRHFPSLALYSFTTPHAILFPEFPLGSVFSSSACSCTTTLVPPLAKIEFGRFGSIEISVSTKLASPL
jgi:hypothetical protein